MKPVPYCLLLLLLTLLGCRAPVGEPAVQPRLYPINDRVDPSPAVAEVEALIAPYREQLTEQMNRELTVLAAPLTKGQPEGTLGNWMADLLAEAATDLFPDREVAFSVQNQGGLRVGEIGAGPLLVSEIYELMPFDNELVLVELTGGELMTFAEHIAAKGGWPVSREVRLQRKSGEVTLTLDGVPVSNDKTYYIVTNDYVANGGSDSEMLVGKPQTKSGHLVRDLLIEYAARDPGPITVRRDGNRIQLN